MTEVKIGGFVSRKNPWKTNIYWLYIERQFVPNDYFYLWLLKIKVNKKFLLSWNSKLVVGKYVYCPEFILLHLFVHCLVGTKIRLDDYRPSKVRSARNESRVAIRILKWMSSRKYGGASIFLFLSMKCFSCNNDVVKKDEMA